MTREETQITWGAAASKSVAFGATEVSDVFSFNAGAWDAAIQLSADNDGTPAAGDLVEFRIHYTAGDILGDTGNDYDTQEYGTVLLAVSTYSADTPGEDPARVTVPLPTVAPKGFRVSAVNKSTGRAITVRARLIEMVGAVT